MKRVWDRLDRKNWSAAAKYRALRWGLGMFCGAVGLLAWLVVRIWALDSLAWLFCFVGYAVVVSWFWTLLLCCRYTFQDGSKAAC